MELMPSDTSLVLAGAWNAAILTPTWVQKFGFDAPVDQRVQVFVPAGLGPVFEFPRYVIGSLSYTIRPDALVVAPQDDSEDSLQLAEDVVARMLRALPHTPLSGIGHNFAFRDPAPQPGILRTFTDANRDLSAVVPQGWHSTSASIALTLKHDERNVLINITRIFDAGIIIMRFNFHHPISSYDEAMNILSGEGDYARIVQNLALATHLAEANGVGNNEN
jgi:hypothetical protein